MKYISLFIIFVLFSFTADAQKLVKTKLSDNIKVDLPASMMPMTKEDKAQRYESSRLPIALYTDADRMVDFGVNRAYTVWQESDIEMVQEFYEVTIMELYDKVDFISKGVKEINGKQFAYFEFESVVYPENDFQGNISKYTYLMYGLNKGTTYVFNFTCEKSVQRQWQSTANNIMNSIVLK